MFLHYLGGCLLHTLNHELAQGTARQYGRTLEEILLNAWYADFQSRIARFI